MGQPIRRPLIAGNWKMNLDLKGSVELVRALAEQVSKDGGGPEVLVAPPFPALTVVAEVLKGTGILLGGQNMHWEGKGAYTGEVSAGQLKDAGCSAVIIGHSERRQYFGETDEGVRKKLAAALAAGLTPIVCIGETLDEREDQKTWRVLETQLKGGLEGFAPADLQPLVVAYEPVWAIGTGKTATPGQAQEAHLFTRKTVAKLHGEALAQSMRILYGGSVKPDNVDILMAEPDVDGALVGGASLKADVFLRIIRFQGPGGS
ncbi:MAG: triose-phosphate isomerase [Elusimicrobiota bacterium]